MTDIAANLATIRARIASACERARRNIDDVTLIAVSKGQTTAAIRAAVDAGQRDFGESYAQELRDKAQELAGLDGIRWHFIGPVQTNKVKYLVPRVVLLHTFDREELGLALHQRLEREHTNLDVLLEVNIGSEPQKHGVLPTGTQRMLEAMRVHPTLRVRGLMCIPPARASSEENRVDFSTMRTLAGRLGLGTLSMGMSSDFEVAIEEGATMVRVGTAIFGERARRGGGA